MAPTGCPSFEDPLSGHPFQFPGWNLDTWASRPEHFTWGGAKGVRGRVGCGPVVSYMSGEHVYPSLQDRFQFPWILVLCHQPALMSGWQPAQRQRHGPWTQDLPLGLSTRNLYSFGRTYFSSGHCVIWSSAHVSFLFVARTFSIPSQIYNLMTLCYTNQTPDLIWFSALNSLYSNTLFIQAWQSVYVFL